RVARQGSAAPRNQNGGEGKLRLKEITDKLELYDPIFPSQWHLFNSDSPRDDLNVTGLWLEGITGEGAVTAIVDDGLDMESKDPRTHSVPDGSSDSNDKGPARKPRGVADKHGTGCGGGGAGVRSGVCGVGVAYDARVAGIRILSAPVTDEDEAMAI